MKSQRGAIAAAAALLCALSLSGCVAAVAPGASAMATASQSTAIGAVVPTDSAGNYVKSPDLQATYAPAPQGGCLVTQIVGDPGPRTIASTAAMSQSILVGTFQGFGAARWNTPGGIRPTSAEFRSTSAVLERPVSITGGTTLRGSPTSLRPAGGRGGQLGCDSIVATDTPVLDLGSRYVFFLF